MMEPNELRAAARDAYVWGYPLVVMHRTRALHCSRIPLGSLWHSDRLATPADRTVVAPNNDTLYASGWYDLTAGDLLINVPPIDRYWSVMLLDAYTHVAYVSRRTHGTQGASVRVTLDSQREPSRGASDVVRMATPTVWILIRTIVDGPEDLVDARNVSRGISVTLPEPHPRHTVARLNRPNKVHEAGAAFFPELAAALSIDASATWHPKPSRAALDLLTRWRDVDAEILGAGVRDGEALISTNPLQLDRTANGWDTNVAGARFGDDLVHRASTAKYGLATHHPAENRSYVAHADAEGSPLDGSKPLSLRFSGAEPPCDGFWSLSVYDSEMFLVGNEIDRYSIGNRTPGLAHETDGSLALIIGGPRPECSSNWLPAPAGPYRLGLRVYEGHPTVVNADWFPPALECICSGTSRVTYATSGRQ